MSAICSSVEIDIGESLPFSRLHHEECNARFQCTSVFLENWFSLKASYSSDHYSISQLDSTLLFPSSS
jgi:hypothetical protein